MYVHRAEFRQWQGRRIDDDSRDHPWYVLLDSRSRDAITFHIDRDGLVVFCDCGFFNGTVYWVIGNSHQSPLVPLRVLLESMAETIR